MLKHTAGLVPAAVLALLLTACGSGSDEPSDAEEGTATGTTSESQSPSESSESPSAPASGPATGADYAALLKALVDQQGELQGATSAEQLNKQADFPPGIAVAVFDQEQQEICLEDSPKEIGLTFSPRGLLLHADDCSGTAVSRVLPDGKNDLKVTGDAALGDPVADYFKEAFAS